MSQPAVTAPPAKPVTLDRDLLQRLASLRLSGVAASVLIVLLAEHDPETGVVLLSQQAIAERLEVNRPAVNTALKTLRGHGIVTSEYRKHTISPEFLGNNEDVVPLRPVGEQPVEEYRAVRFGEPKTTRPTLTVLDPA